MLFAFNIVAAEWMWQCLYYCLQRNVCKFRLILLARHGIFSVWREKFPFLCKFSCLLSIEFFCCIWRYCKSSAGEALHYFQKSCWDMRGHVKQSEGKLMLFLSAFSVFHHWLRTQCEKRDFGISSWNNAFFRPLLFILLCM